MNSQSKGPFLAIKNLHVRVDKKPILHGVNLTVRSGEMHLLMGKNGQGKTSIAQVLAGAPGYEVTQGEIIYKGEDLLACTAEERAARGLFVAFQNPIAIPGVSVINFLKASLDALYKARGKAVMRAPDILALVKNKMTTLEIDPSFLSRNLHEGFSGGEKKRIELLQMAVLDPTFAILDEPDSGLDADALKVLGKNLQSMQATDKSLLMITHYARLFDYITPDYVHIINEGRIIRTGDVNLANQLLKEGYGTLPTGQDEPSLL